MGTENVCHNIGVKVCSKCGSEKDDSEFYVYKKTGKLWGKCKRCHVSECVARAAADPKTHNARTTAWRAANPGRASAIARAWQLRNPEKTKQIARQGKYRIDFNAVWEVQGGLCACCGLPMLREGREKASVCVDHDRTCCPDRKSCGKCVRGLIHWSCNLVLGYAQDDPEILRKAAAYVERHRGR